MVGTALIFAEWTMPLEASIWFGATTCSGRIECDLHQVVRGPLSARLGPRSRGTRYPARTFGGSHQCWKNEWLYIFGDCEVSAALAKKEEAKPYFESAYNKLSRNGWYSDNKTSELSRMQELYKKRY